MPLGADAAILNWTYIWIGAVRQHGGSVDPQMEGCRIRAWRLSAFLPIVLVLWQLEHSCDSWSDPGEPVEFGAHNRVDAHSGMLYHGRLGASITTSKKILPSLRSSISLGLSFSLTLPTQVENRWGFAPGPAIWRRQLLWLSDRIDSGGKWQRISPPIFISGLGNGRMLNKIHSVHGGNYCNGRVAGARVLSPYSECSSEYEWNSRAI